MGKIKVGVVGCGGRGRGLMADCFVYIKDMEVVAVCDNFENRAEETAAMLREKTEYNPRAFTDFEEMLACPDVEAILVTSPWETHIPFAIRAMEAKKPVGIEVGGATSLQECWDLVRAWEKTRTPFMFMENCCFGRTELFVTRMVREGLFGEIVHATGAYAHDLRDEISGGDVNHHYRLRHYRSRNCENYPTHELGPIAKILNINSGNRMVSLTSTASKAAGLNAYGTPGRFNQGDVVNTIIKCAGGESILLTLDTTLPRYYSRDFTIRGVKGMYEERTNSVFIDGEAENHWDWRPNWNNAEKFMEKYEHPIWDKFLHDGVTGGHGGMDGLVFGAFIECLKNGWDMPIDVYDAAAWMSITPLSEKSISLGSAPVEIPDFTSGSWLFMHDSMNEYTIKHC